MNLYLKSFLHNRLGGLQVLPPGSSTWYYVKVMYLRRTCTRQSLTSTLQPIPGHAICNIGDALNIFSGGILRSNIHRVVYGRLSPS